jgi:hypothetical protein
MEPEEAAVHAARALIEEQRATCLWFLREDLIPSDRSRLIELLRKIEQHSDRVTFVKARRIRQWLSRDSNAPSQGF